ncbi:hypothetical protein [Pseudomonas sp.]|uniref:hypothetical protein n=1 Tax=Pseudomonas sp. TaxID=306 RepID=UPI00262DD6EB|nr:hypothetical protein [Pseudomonas sp.]
MSLFDAFTDEDLLEELVRRRNAAKRDYQPAKFCEDCMRFRTWGGAGDPPKTYNPCGKKHRMEFHAPASYGQLNDFGYYRAICTDRQECQQ